MFRLCLMTSVVFSRPERMKTFNWRWYFELTLALEWSRLLKLLYLSKKILYERQLKERKVDKIVKVLKNLRNVVFKQLQKEYLKIVVNHILQPVIGFELSRWTCLLEIYFMKIMLQCQRSSKTGPIFIE